jgi:hypothetical protein
MLRIESHINEAGSTPPTFREEYRNYSPFASIGDSWSGALEKLRKEQA